MENTWIELDLKILRDNIHSLKKVLGSKPEIIFIVKSNAYGHGLETVARCAWDAGIRWFAVAYAQEAFKLREILPEAEIIVVGVVKPKDVPAIIEKRIISVITSRKHALLLLRNIKDQPLRCHAKVDTGMGRLGFMWKTAAEELIDLAKEKGLDVCGICSHFSSSNSPDSKFVNTQAKRFREVLDTCEQNGFKTLFKHIANSGAIFHDSVKNMDGIRPGILLYGYGKKKESGVPSDERGAGRSQKPEVRKIETRPFLRWKTRVVQVKKVPAGFPVSYDGTYVTETETYVATIDVGYADGYSRALSNKGFVIIGGKRWPVIGKVTMNLIMVNVGPENSVKEGDEVVLIGKQGGESVWADEIAELSGTISYEVLTGIKAEHRAAKT
ncbi:alanine racemase [Verrucomicrobiota bacterium]